MQFSIAQVWQGSPETPDEIAFEIFKVADLTETQAAELRDANDTLRRFLNGNLFSLVMLNRKFQADADAHLAEEYSANPGLLDTTGTTIYRIAVTSLANFAASIHTYQEHSELLAARVGGSELRDHVQQRFREHYDTHPALYLMRQIRNVIVHSTLSLVSLRAGSRVRPGEPGEVERWATVTLNKPLLLQQSRINQALKSHLNNFETITVLEAMDRAADDLRPLDHELLPLLYPTLYEAALTLTDLDDRLRKEFMPDHSCFLMTLPDDVQPSMQMGNMSLVGEILNFARDVVGKVQPISPVPSKSDNPQKDQ